MEIAYRISEDDYVGAARLAAVATKQQVMWLSLAGLLLLALALFGEGSIRFMGGFGLAGGLAGYGLTVWVLLPSRARRQYRDYKLLHQDLSFELVGSGYRLRAPSGESRIAWSDLLRWRENDAYMLLYFAPKLFHLIPKRLSAQGLDVDGLRHRLQSQVGAAT